MEFHDLFNTKPLIGMVHLPALHGSPNSKMSVDELIEYSVSEAEKLEDAGLDAIIVENVGDVPLLKSNLPPYVVAEMSVIVREVVKRTRLRVGVNMLRNGCVEALSVAHACSAHFIRCNVLVGAYVTDQGIIEGCSAELMRVKRTIGSEVLVFGDVHVKHAYPLFNVEIEQAAADMAERAGADAVIVSGPRSPDPPPVERVLRVKKAINKPVLVGSGISLSNIAEYFKVSDGLIIGERDFKVNGVWGGASDERAYKRAVELCRE